MTEKEKQNYDLVVHYLDIIFLDNKTTDLLRSDKNFQEIITNDISIVKYFDKIESNSNNSNRFIKSYEMITTKKFVNNDKLNFSNFNDIVDTIKYTNIYLLNTLRLSIEQIDSINKSNNEANIKEETSREIPSSNEFQGNYKSDEEIIRSSGYTMHDVADQLIMTQANMILSKNISKGKVYVYNSKPKFIPIIKFIVIALLFIMFVLSIAAFALVAKYGENVEVIVDGSSNLQFFSSSSIASYIFQFIFVLIILGFISFSMFKNFKNDNSKYKFSWGVMSFYIVLFLMSTFMFSWNILINKPNIAADSNPNSVHQIFTNAANIQIAIFVVIGLVVVFTVIGAILNPRRDEKRIMKLLEQYASEIRNGQIDTSNLGGGSMFSGPFGPSSWF